MRAVLKYRKDFHVKEEIDLTQLTFSSLTLIKWRLAGNAEETLKGINLDDVRIQTIMFMPQVWFINSTLVKYHQFHSRSDTVGCSQNPIGLMMAPPHRWLPRNLNPTCHGQ